MSPIRVGPFVDDKEELKYRGFMGHTVCVLTTGGGSLETCDLKSARAYAAEQGPGRNPRIYRRTRTGWRAVRL